MFKLSDFNEKTQADIRAQLAAAPVVGGRQTCCTKPNGGREVENRSMEGPAHILEYRISLIQFRHRRLDAHDSLAFAVKPLVDEIARFLGFSDDSNPRLHWEYDQHETKGREGTFVKIEIL